jgi:hypothetical protein
MLEMIALETSYKSKATTKKINIYDIHNLERTFWTHGKDLVQDLVYEFGFGPNSLIISSNCHHPHWINLKMGNLSRSDPKPQTQNYKKQE